MAAPPGPRLDACVEQAVERVHELENELGCFFDRNPDGTLHFKAFAGQSFDRTVHKGDLTGIEIINRLMEQVWARSASSELEEHRRRRADPGPRRQQRIAGVLLIDMRTRRVPLCRRRKAVLLATGGGPTMYLYHTPSGDKIDGRSGDGARVSACRLRDMEMVQFHPTGLLAGPDTRMTGTVLEEGLRGAGGYLLNGAGRALHGRIRPARANAPRATSSAAACMPRCARARRRRMAASTSRWRISGRRRSRRQFKGMVKRCADCGFDLAGGRVEVVPTAHYMMGGVDMRRRTRRRRSPAFTRRARMRAAMHGANRLGGNGVANSTVFGGIAGDVMAAAAPGLAFLEPDEDRDRRGDRAGAVPVDASRAAI